MAAVKKVEGQIGKVGKAAVGRARKATEAKPKTYMHEQADEDSKVGLMGSIDGGFKKMKPVCAELAKVIGLALDTNDLKTQWHLLTHAKELAKDIQSYQHGTVRQAKASGIEKLL